MSAACHRTQSAVAMTDLLDMREKYLTTGQIDPAIRPVVLESWQRCQSYQLEPGSLRVQQPDPERLAAARRNSPALLYAAEPLLALAHQTLADQPHLLALSDSHGLILRLWTDPVARQASRSGGNLFEGADWREQEIGCNGIGTCLHIRRPVILIGPEHYQGVYIGWTCIGVPLKTFDGTVVGGLDLSVPNAHIQTHTWGWILSVATTIETALSYDRDNPPPELLAPELSNPLNTVQGVLDLLGQDVGLSATHAQFIKEARVKLGTSKQRLQMTMNALAETQQRLVDERDTLARSEERLRLASDAAGFGSYDYDHATGQLLDMGRITSGKLRLNRRRIDIAELVNNAVDSVQFAAEAKSIDVRIAFEDDLEPFECDPTRIQQIIWNLLTNAVKFTPEGGRVQLQVHQSSTNITIMVQDTGKGIDPEFLPHLFERFGQEVGGHARQHSGLGLGLSIVKQLVEAHGGTIQADSAGEGQGATFVVTLLRLKIDLEPQAVPSHRQTPANADPVDLDEQTLTGIRILCVDDDDFSCELLQRILSDAGAVVETAGSVAQALSLLKTQRFDLLISDLGMPVQDGYSFIRKLRSQHDWMAKLPAVALSALGRPEDREVALQAGFDVHLTKPFDPGRLCQVVRELVQASGRTVPVWVAPEPMYSSPVWL